VEPGIVGNLASCADPHRLMRHPFVSHSRVDRLFDMAHLDRALIEVALAHRMQPREDGVVREEVGSRDAGRHLVLVFQARGIHLEGGDHREDRYAFLEGLSPSCGEGATVVDPIDREGHPSGRIAGAEEVAVHRMRRAPVVDGAFCGDDRLSEHLAAEDSPEGHRLRDAGEDVLRRPGIAGGEVQHSQEPIDVSRIAHGVPSRAPMSSL